MRSWPSWVRQMQGAWRSWSYELFGRKGAFRPPQFPRKGAQWCFSSTHTCTGQRIDITKLGGQKNQRCFFTDIWGWLCGRSELSDAKVRAKSMASGKKAKHRRKWRAGLQRLKISIAMDHLALCTPGLTGFSVEIWRLKPTNILLETVVSAALIFASKG